MGLERIKSHIDGDGGIRQLLVIALPMFISQAADTLMMFVDRLFLARLGKVYMAAAMTGGMTSFMMLTFFLGIIGYTNALVAQYLGSGREKTCGAAAAQGLLFGLISYPVILLLAPAGLWIMRNSGHDPQQLEAETTYFSILIWFAFVPLLRSAAGGFFSGLGRTRVVMVSNIIAMVVNIVFNYLLIFGKLGFPALGIRGAAYGTIIGGCVGVAVLLGAYFAAPNRRNYGTWSRLKLDPDIARRLLRFGLPSGIEFCLNMTAFNLFVQLMHSYGRDVAAAVTITFNWDMVAFVPMIGVNIATTSLVGRYMGAAKPDIAERAAYSGLKTASIYTLTVWVLFVTVPHLLVRMFTPDIPGLDYSAVIPQAVLMIRLASFYLVSDALMLVFGGALRGAGDTQWVMRTSVVCHWFMTTATYLQIKVWRVPPTVVWIVFVTLVTLMGGIFFWRFRGGSWKQLSVIDDVPKQPSDTVIGMPAIQDFPEVDD